MANTNKPVVTEQEAFDGKMSFVRDVVVIDDQGDVVVPEPVPPQDKPAAPDKSVE